MISFGPHIHIDGVELLTTPQQRMDDRTEATRALVNTLVGAHDAQEAYERTVLMVLITIASNPVGSILLQQFANLSHTLTIRPLLSQIIKQTAVQDFDAKAASDHSIFPGGGGSDSTLRYSPESWWYADGREGIDPGSHVNCDDVLVHEMMHALRIARGLRLTMPLSNHLDDLEEFYGILISNIYLSSAGRDQDMRNDHRLTWIPLGGKNLDPLIGFIYNDPDNGDHPQWRESRGFAEAFQDNLMLLEIDQAELFHALQDVQCNFNPFRAYRKIWEERLQFRMQMYDSLPDFPAGTGK
jgi:hypothetical protein